MHPVAPSGGPPGEWTSLCLRVLYFFAIPHSRKKVQKYYTITDTIRCNIENFMVSKLVRLGNLMVDVLSKRWSSVLQESARRWKTV